jgi:hypothetical protein
MSKQSRAVPFVQSIFHSSDFSEASELAFAHALAIALIRQTELVIMHARRGEREDWSRFPAVRKTLVRWRLLAAGSLPSEVFEKLAVRITKMSMLLGVDAARESWLISVVMSLQIGRVDYAYGVERGEPAVLPGHQGG